MMWLRTVVLVSCAVSSVVSVADLDNDVFPEDFLQHLASRSKKSPAIVDDMDEDVRAFESELPLYPKPLLTEDLKHKTVPEIILKTYKNVESAVEDSNNDGDKPVYSKPMPTDDLKNKTVPEIILRTYKNVESAVEGSKNDGDETVLKKDEEILEDGLSTDDDSVRLTRQYYPYRQQNYYRPIGNINRGGSMYTGNSRGESLKVSPPLSPLLYSDRDDPYIAAVYNPSARTFELPGYTAQFAGGVKTDVETKNPTLDKTGVETEIKGGVETEIKGGVETEIKGGVETTHYAGVQKGGHVSIIKPLKQLKQVLPGFISALAAAMTPPAGAVTTVTGGAAGYGHGAAGYGHGVAIKPIKHKPIKLKPIKIYKIEKPEINVHTIKPAAATTLNHGKKGLPGFFFSKQLIFGVGTDGKFGISGHSYDSPTPSYHSYPEGHSYPSPAIAVYPQEQPYYTTVSSYPQGHAYVAPTYSAYPQDAYYSSAYSAYPEENYGSTFTSYPGYAYFTPTSRWDPQAQYFPDNNYKTTTDDLYQFQSNVGQGPYVYNYENKNADIPNPSLRSHPLEDEKYLTLDQLNTGIKIEKKKIEEIQKEFEKDTERFNSEANQGKTAERLNEINELYLKWTNLKQELDKIQEETGDDDEQDLNTKQR